MTKLYNCSNLIKMKKDKRPLMTVVTVCYNAIEEIERTLLSVLGQSYKNIEYIVIDGGSTDGTVEIIKKYANNIGHFISEPDHGIYDAMNKGIAKASGEWIIFMNAGDVFANDNILELWQSKNKEDEGVDLYYGDVILKYKLGDRFLPSKNISKLRETMCFSHQSCIIRTSVMKDFGYSLAYRYAADYNFLLSIFFKGYKFKYVNIALAKVDFDSGATFDNFVKSKKEVRKIHRSLGYSRFEANMTYLKFVERYRLSRLLKRILPKQMLKRLMNIN